MKKNKRKIKRPYRKRKYSLEEKQAYADKLRKRMTPAERVLWREIKHSGWEAQQVICGYIPDFVHREARLILEVDGKIHLKKKKQDSIRTAHLNKKGWAVLRVTNQDVFDRIRYVLNLIEKAL